MDDIFWNDIHKKFSAPFRPEEIGTNQSNKGGGPYVDARSVAERLDDAVGPGAWETIFQLIDAASGAVECTLAIHGISKSDVGYPNSVMGTLTKSGTTLENEPLKAAYSDAFKRAAVQWGIGRYLYPYASKRKREPGEVDDDKPETPKTTSDGSLVDTETGEKFDLEAYRLSVRDKVIDVAKKQNREHVDVFKAAVKAKGITNQGGMPAFDKSELDKIHVWCQSELKK